jgi:ketosteroid isomerase-like protein
MMKSAVWCMVAMLALLVAAQAADKEMSGGEQAVSALEQKWVDAEKASNAEAIAPLLAFSFIETGSDGKVAAKEQVLARIKGEKWETSQISDVKVTLYGKTAIATGEWQGKGTDPNGQPIAAHERWTDTWIKMFDGKWQCVASHSSPIKM